MDNLLRNTKATNPESKNTESKTPEDSSTPNGWFPLDEEFELTEQDKESGLADFLYEARDTAAEAIGGLFEGLGIDEKFYQHVRDIPIGLKDKSNNPGMSYPGQYGIVLGRDSEDVVDYTSGIKDEIELRRTRNNLARTMAHEMIHSIQTVSPETDYDRFEFLGHTIMNLAGFEEGMAEALGNISVGMLKNQSVLKDEALKLENYCAKRGDVPATQMASRAIRKMDPEFLKWYLTCAQTGEYERNRIKEIFGPRRFLMDMITLDDYECGKNHDEYLKDVTLQAVTKMIDAAA